MAVGEVLNWEESGVANQGESEEVIESREEEAQPARVPTTPYTPTQDEVDEHSIDHIPYRCWCKHCLDGFGRGDAHRVVGHARSIPVVSLDYRFVTKTGVFEGSEWEAIGEQEYLQVSVIRGRRSGALFAHAVPKKEVDGQRYVIDNILDECTWLGYNKIMLKSGNGREIVRFVADAMLALRIQGHADQAAAEHSVPYDPATNGNAESGVKLVNGSFKTLRSCLGHRLGHCISIGHPLSARLITHSADVRTLRIRGSDGTIAYQKVRGKQLSSRLLGFAECR